MTTLSFDVLWRGAAAEKGMRDLGNQTERTAGRFKGLKVAGVAALAAVGAATVKFGRDSVSAYVEAEGSQVRLQEAFRKFPKLADSNIGSLNRLNAELAKKTKFDDDATASGQAVLAQFKLTGKQITELTPLLQDYAAKTGKDLPTAARDLGKATLGQGRRLKDVGIDFKDTGSAAGNLAQVTRGLRAQVGGFAEKEGKSAAGQSAILKNQFGELQEAAGAQLLPALLKVGRGLLAVVGFVQDNSALLGSFKTIVVDTFNVFARSAGLGKVSFRGFAEFIETHQADITSGFVTSAKVALGLGDALAQGASIGLRALAGLLDGQATVTSMMVVNFGNVLRGAALAFGWVPGLGPKLQTASAKFDRFGASAVAGMRKAADGARNAADGIDTTIRPSIAKAQAGLDKVGRTEIVKAQLRDSAAKAGQVIDGIGTSSSGAQLKLKKFADVSKLSATEQRDLRSRIDSARGALRDQIRAAQDAGVGQKALTRTWKEGRDRLYDEFVQMGLSKREAGRLADQYAGIQPKVRTKVETPGMDDARSDAADLRRKYGDIPKSVTTKINWDTAVDDVNTKLTFRYGKAARLMSAGGPDAGAGFGPQLPAMSAPRDDHASGGPSGGAFKAMVSRGTDAVVKHGTSAVSDLLKQLSPGLAAPGVAPGSPGGRLGVVGRGMAGTIAAMRARGASSFTTYPGHHPSMAKARDVTPHSWAIANAARASSSVWYVIYRMMIASKNWGNVWRPYRPTNFRGDWQHVRHVHVGWYDKGGVTRGLHAVGRPERVLSPTQTMAFDRLVHVLDRSGGATNVEVHLHAPNYVGSREDLRRVFIEMLRSNQLEVIRR